MCGGIEAGQIEKSGTAGFFNLPSQVVELGIQVAQ
jgi:hypothetical protein